MAVLPIRITATGTVEVSHDDHGGSLPLSSLTFAKRIDGSDDPRFVVVPCPGCPAVSTHPISGGAAPEHVQRLFMRLALARRAAFGATANAGRAAVKRRVRLLVGAMDGAERWKLGADDDDEGDAPLDAATQNETEA